jgi:hypothetical protein
LLHLPVIKYVVGTVHLFVAPAMLKLFSKVLSVKKE